MGQGDRGVIGDPLLGGAPPGPLAGRQAPARPVASTSVGALPEPVRRRAVPPAADFRPDIEGLRALAVVAVLLYHAELGPFHGGYVGVDVFFVLSGFLITRLLLHEVDRTGTVSLPRFWARRARRLLPASTLVVVVTVIASRAVLDPLSQDFVNRSAVAASAFVANILFFTRGGYSQLTLPEPLLHFWSLAVEEQFYLFWPLTLFGLSRLRVDLRRAVTWVAAIVGVASFVACVAISRTRQPFAFYWLPTRAWELLVGAGLAVAGSRVATGSARLRAGAAWFGLGAVVVATVVFIDPQYQFPGALALVPVAATALVIIGGSADTPAGPGRLLGLAPMLWIGQRSYAIYLWHFPVLVLADAKWGPLSVVQRIALLAGSVVLAHVSYTLLEDPVRRSEWLAAVPRRSLALGGGLAAAGVTAALLMAVVAPSLDTGVLAESPTVIVSAPATDPAAPDPTGPTPTTLPAVDTVPVTTPANGSYPENPAALVSLAAANAATLETAAATEVAPSNLRPSLRRAYEDKPPIYDNGCILGDGTRTPKDCWYGDVGSGTTVVLFGDSHAAQWFTAMNAAAVNRGWRLVVFTKMGCPTADIPVTNQVRAPECGPWRDAVLERIDALDPDVVVLSAYRYKGSDDAIWRRGLDRTMARLRPLADRVLVLGDTPTPKLDVPSCVAGNLRNVGTCMSSRDAAIRPGRLTAEYQVAAEYGADFVTTYDWLCSEQWCPVIIGDMLVYRDDSHITTTAAGWLTPYVEAAIAPLVGG
jgi:peptidoglycan/LPS O-acetylase OafA/YrhL